MPRSRSWRWLGPGIALLTCIGVWLSHTLEYIRVWGWLGLDQELYGSVHLYMVPLGVVLVFLVAGAAVALMRLRRMLTRRLERAFDRLRGIWRTGPQDLASPKLAAGSATPWSTRRLVLVLGGTLAALQIGLYLIQENLESALTGGPIPGLSVITGVHWVAPLIHAVVGFVLATVCVALSALFRRREAVVEHLERAVQAILAMLAARRVRPLLAAPAQPRHHGAPAYLGASIWCRPPPLS